MYYNAIGLVAIYASKWCSVVWFVGSRLGLEMGLGSLSSVWACSQWFRQWDNLFYSIGSLFPLTCFPDLTFSLISDEYQIQILSSVLRKVNADYHQVGWYQSAYLGTHWCCWRAMLTHQAIHESIVTYLRSSKIVKLIKFIRQALSCIFAYCTCTLST